MIITKKASDLDGRTICGQTFIPADGDSAHAIYTRGDRVCGITYEMGFTRPYLRCSPGLMLPPGSRDAKAWKRATWMADDDRFFEIELDARDGELIYYYKEPDLAENIEHHIEVALDFMLGDELHDFVVDFVAERLGTQND